MSKRQRRQCQERELLERRRRCHKSGATQLAIVNKLWGEERLNLHKTCFRESENGSQSTRIVVNEKYSHLETN